MKSYPISKILSASLLLVFILSACSVVDPIFNRFLGEEDIGGAAELMAEGEDYFNRGDYTGAVEAFQNVKDRYPYSRYAIKAELRVGDSHYEKEEYQEAYDAYDEFEKLHPTNKEIPYVIYRKGMCLFDQVTTIDREQVHTRDAKKEFERLIKRYPRSDYANKARNNIRKCYIFLAEYELYVGRYYYDMKVYKAAIERFKYVVENYPDLGQYHEALEYISLCNQKIKDQEAGIVEKATGVKGIIEKIL